MLFKYSWMLFKDAALLCFEKVTKKRQFGSVAREIYKGITRHFAKQ